MPIYLYQHPQTDEVLEVFQGMNDIHEYTDDSGVQWNRIFLSPNAAIDPDADPFDNSKFIEKPPTRELWAKCGTEAQK